MSTKRELGLVRTVKAVCPHDCPDTCGIVVTVDQETGRAVDLRGDKEHPFTKGFLCQKVSNYLERVYHPDRLLYPMKRIGPKGEGKFARISWDEAIRTIAEKFRAIAASEDGPQAILPYSYAGTMGKLMYSSLDRRFFHRLGASLLDRTICATAGAVGCDVTLGTRAVTDPEAAVNSRYIVNWGSNTAVTNIHFWKIEHEARKRGAKIVTIDPYKSPTAAKSDWWIPVRPGTDAALALGVMHIIFREGWQDDAYLNDHCVGAEQLRTRALNEYPPEKVAYITGLSVEEIERFAREYARSQELFGGPALIRLNYGLQRHGGGGMAVRTIVCLPALTGDWRYPGAGALLSTSKAYPFDDNYLMRPDLVPKNTRTINMVNLAEALHGELPGPSVQALFVYNSNPAAVNPDQSRVLSGLAREDLFTVVHDQFQTDTADFADIVLPATTQLEHFDIHSSYGHLYVQANNPAIAPLGEAKPNTEVFRLLARAMGFEPELFEESDEEIARRSIRDGENPPEPTAMTGITLDDTKAGPVRLKLPSNWAPFATGEFPTLSGKCELYSEREARAGRDPLPYYAPPHEDPQTKPELAAKYPLQLLTPPASSFLNSTFVNVNTLRKSAGERTLEIHPTDATRRNIADGQMVRVFNGRGRFRARAIIAESVKPGVVVSLGLWWRKFTDDGANCNSTTSTATTDFGGGATFFDNLVEVTAL
ncbi:Dimethyl sulfoxide reductase DmsA precursor [Gemmata sp. SH-PL17]|uniref:molybdopterin-containing oxidoreductase family protein n=1 Tax=Gemmata sp. SH-PL17 TaxID=1630693 RepID=UPI0004BA688E|nr:molybdopterin oxidoreductase family protein [Gemmata sp. SH-PL17]AMV28884.1 Dimethyl sulfoxide reductase DmsA precursor [Gemmata sp. SH-PL17]